MSFEQINWQFVEGTKAFHTFGNMLGKAFGDANIPLHTRAQSAWDSRGYYSKDKRFWAGIYLAQPDILAFEFAESNPDPSRIEEVGRFQLIDGKHKLTLELNSETVHFFSRNAEGQLAFLTEWLKRAYEDGVKCLASDNE